jgi:hypothetical protein
LVNAHVLPLDYWLPKINLYGSSSQNDARDENPGVVNLDLKVSMRLDHVVNAMLARRLPARHKLTLLKTNPSR